MEAVVHTPGCFGAPTVFDFESPVCRVCPHFAECRDKSRAKLEALRSKIDVRDLLLKHESAARRDKSEPSSAGKGETAPAPAAIVTTIVPPERKTRLERVKFDLTKGDEIVMGQLPVKVAKEYRKLIATGQDKLAREKLAAGENPFPFEGKKFLHVAFELLLGQGGFTRAELREQFKKRLSWTEGTAAAHVSIVVALLPALGFAQEDSGKFVLNPALAK